ncbi:AIPR family protein, partial [Salmonella enterica subsp. enterica serovar Hvittingfoss]|nr:AIPR family protein [Salmonella enterica subsp. enterica serovar Hvittingfoss]
MEILKNRILLGVLNDFKNDFNIDEDEAKSFESFVNYVVLSKYDSETFDDTDTFDIVDVDSNGTYGIDSFALFINDKIVRNANEIEWFRKTNRMDVRFVFIQTKRSTSVDIGDFLKFTSAVSNFLQDGEGIKIEDDLKNSKNMLDELFKPENMRLFANNKPVCDLYYATSGVKSDDEKFLGALNQQKKAINRDNPEIGEVNIVQIGADYLITSYNEIENNHTVEIEFQNNIDCGNDIEDIEQAFIGYLPVDEFIKLITDGDKRL